MKWTKTLIDQKIDRLTDDLMAEYGLRIAKRIITQVKRNLAAETTRRKNL